VQTAFELYKRALQKNKKVDAQSRSIVVRELGVCCMRLQEFSEAAKYFNEYLKHDSKSYDVWVDLAQSYLDMKELNKAKKALKKAIDLREGAMAFYVLSTLFHSEGEIDKAFRYAKKSVALQQHESDLRDPAAVIYHYSLMRLQRNYLAKAGIVISSAYIG
jgi:tetratricopeptide (TPR) repeat protein